MDVVLTKYANGEIPKQDVEGPAIWRCRNRHVEARIALITDIKPEGFKKKQRGGKSVKDYRNDIGWCKEHGVEANFATKLALKAQAERQWAEMTDVTAHEDRFSGISSEDVVSSHHLLDMLAKKDEKAYEVNQLKGKGKTQWSGPNGGKGVAGYLDGYGNSAPAPPANFNMCDAVGMDQRAVGGLLAGEETPGGVQAWMAAKGKGGPQLGVISADSAANAELESFLDFMQHDSTPGGTSAYQPSSAAAPGGVATPSLQHSLGEDPYATPQLRMEQFDDWSRVGQQGNRGTGQSSSSHRQSGTGRHDEDEEEFISSRRERGNRRAERKDEQVGRNDRGRKDIRGSLGRNERYDNRRTGRCVGDGSPREGGGRDDRRDRSRDRREGRRGGRGDSRGRRR